MVTNLTFEEVEKIVEELEKKRYIVFINGDTKSIQIILKTNFEEEIVNRINEIKSIIIKQKNIKNLEKQIEIKDVIYYNKKHKAIEIKY